VGRLPIGKAPLLWAPLPKLDEPRVVPSNSVFTRPPVVDPYQALSAVASPMVDRIIVDRSAPPHPWLTRRSMEPGTAPSITIQTIPNSLNSMTMYPVSTVDAVVAMNRCAMVNVAVTATGLDPPRPSGNAPVKPRMVPAKNVVVVAEPVEVPVPPSLLCSTESG